MIIIMHDLTSINADDFVCIMCEGCAAEQGFRAGWKSLRLTGSIARCCAKGAVPTKMNQMFTCPYTK